MIRGFWLPPHRPRQRQVLKRAVCSDVALLLCLGGSSYPLPPSSASGLLGYTYGTHPFSTAQILGPRHVSPVLARHAPQTVPDGTYIVHDVS